MLSGLDQVDQQGLAVFVEDLGARRKPELDALAVRPAAVAPGAGTAVLGLEMPLVAEVDQGVERRYAKRPHIAAAAAGAAVGTAVFDIFFAPETDAAGAAVAAADIDPGFIEEFHGRAPIKIKKRGMESHSPDNRVPVREYAGGSQLGGTGGSTETNERPPLRRENLTAPSVSANRVWSRPTPTPAPALILVPR